MHIKPAYPGIHHLEMTEEIMDTIPALSKVYLHQALPKAAWMNSTHQGTVQQRGQQRL